MLKNKKFKWNVNNNELHIIWEDWKKPVNLNNINNIVSNNINVSYDPNNLFKIVLKDDNVSFKGAITTKSKCIFKNSTEKVEYYFLKL